MSSSSGVKEKPIAVIDLFCGAGGLTVGLRKARLQVVAGIDVDGSCAFAVEANNPGTRFIKMDVAKLTARQLGSLYPKGAIKVLAGLRPLPTVLPVRRSG